MKQWGVSSLIGEAFLIGQSKQIDRTTIEK